MGDAARGLGYEYLAICDHTRNVRVVPGLDADEVRRQGEEIAAANEQLAPFRILRGIECDILPDGSLDLPDDVLAELDWVQLSLHAGQREEGSSLTKKRCSGCPLPASCPRSRSIRLTTFGCIVSELARGLPLRINRPPRSTHALGGVRQAISKIHSASSSGLSLTVQRNLRKISEVPEL
jgi:hypothetical protein